MAIQIRTVSKRFGDFRALDNVDLDIGDGELVALLGPSGCGKTTLLRIIAGLESADTGSIAFSGKDATRLDVIARQVGFVFQHYALFRHMSVFENVAFGLRVKPRGERPSEAAIKAKVTDLLKLVQLDWLADRYPAQLSGGQRQRIALARALAVEPQVLLLDEPFGALDAKVRKELRRWLRRLHDELHVTSIFVTHDQEEALEVSDRVVLMNAGRIEQVGTPEQVWAEPASPFVYGFLGDVNLFHGRADEGRADFGGGVVLPTPADAARGAVNAMAFVRPYDLEVEPGVVDGGIVATIMRTLVIGPTAQLELDRRSDGSPIEVHLDSERFRSLGLAEGQTVTVRPRHARVFVEAQAAKLESGRSQR
ncbi:sulfate ABC transporter ATP-binding protein [soil metagenome]